MSAIQSTARLRIHDGKLAEFKRVAARCIETVRTKDTGTVQYDWFLDETASECVVREAYRDSGAVFEHMENLGPVLGDLLALCEMELEIYGRPSQALTDVLLDCAPADDHEDSARIDSPWLGLLACRRVARR